MPMNSKLTAWGMRSAALRMGGLRIVVGPSRVQTVWPGKVVIVATTIGSGLQFSNRAMPRGGDRMDKTKDATYEMHRFPYIIVDTRIIWPATTRLSWILSGGLCRRFAGPPCERSRFRP